MNLRFILVLNQIDTFGKSDAAHLYPSNQRIPFILSRLGEHQQSREKYHGIYYRRMQVLKRPSILLLTLVNLWYTLTTSHTQSQHGSNNKKMNNRKWINCSRLHTLCRLQAVKLLEYSTKLLAVVIFLYTGNHLSITDRYYYNPKVIIL